MCVNYTPSRQETIEDEFNAGFKLPSFDDIDWKPETWQDYPAPIIRHFDGARQALLAQYSMIPKDKIPPGVKRYTTMNARAETIGELRSYAKPWREGKLCLVPMRNFFEPNYESGSAVRWKIGLIDQDDFAVAGIYKEWPDQDGLPTYSFSQITINADTHPLMKRFHKPGDEKRALVVIHKNDFDDWMSCTNPEMARAFLTNYPAELMYAEPAPIPPRKKAQASLI